MPNGACWNLCCHRRVCRGRRWAWPQREIINAIFYVLRAGCAWRMLPDSFPPWRTTYRWFARLRDSAVFESLNHHLVMHDRERAGREASPSAAVIDSQSVKTTDRRRPARLRRGQENQGSQASCDGRYRWVRFVAAFPSCLDPGP